jgi:Sulfotransferase family
MLSQAHRFIFLHVPRTGGNSIQSYLLPFSEDSKQIREKQDGIDTFGIAGLLTPHKHATLPDYAAVVQLSDYKIAMSVRHPIDRALSFYFAPIRVLSRDRAAQAPFELDAFNTMVRDMRPMADFVRIGERIEMPRLVLRYENGVSSNIVKLAQFLELPTPEDVGHLNAGEADQRDTVQCDHRIAKTVRRRFAEDFELFGYA